MKWITKKIVQTNHFLENEMTIGGGQRHQTGSNYWTIWLKWHKKQQHENGNQNTDQASLIKKRGKTFSRDDVQKQGRGCWREIWHHWLSGIFETND